MAWVKTRIDHFWKCDLTSLRVLLYSASLLWAILLAFPGALERPEYAVMNRLASDDTWRLCFMVHGLAGLARLTVPAIYPNWVASFKNAFGVGIWCTSSFSIMFSEYPPIGAVVGSVVLSFAAFWLFVRTPFGWVED